jgi:hypothetical protein
VFVTGSAQARTVAKSTMAEVREAMHI